MANERDHQLSDNDNRPTTGQRSQENEFGQRGPEFGKGRGQMANQGSEGSFGGQSSGSHSGSADTNGSSIAHGENAGQPRAGEDDGTSGQPIGGNDSATGTGTTLTQGADFGRENVASSTGNRDRDATITGDRERSPAAAADDERFGHGTTSNTGGSSVGSDQTSGGSSGVSGGKGFIGSRASGPDDHLTGSESSPEHSTTGSDAQATGGSDFAGQGRGALEGAPQDGGEQGSSETDGEPS